MSGSKNYGTFTQWNSTQQRERRSLYHSLSFLFIDIQLKPCLNLRTNTLKIQEAGHLSWAELCGSPPPPSVFVEVLTRQNVTAFADRTFEEVIKVKLVHSGGSLILKTGAFRRGDGMQMCTEGCRWGHREDRHLKVKGQVSEDIHPADTWISPWPSKL